SPREGGTMKRLLKFARLPGLNAHRFFARLHGARTETVTGQTNERSSSEDFQSAYAAYASATAHANMMLQQHGAQSPEFATADIASMRLFHRARKMQGLKKPRSSDG